jgi:protein TonB
MTSAMFSAEINKIGTSQMGSMETDSHTKRLAVILGLVLLAHGLTILVVMQIRSTHKFVLPTTTIAIRLVTMTPDQPKPLPPKPLVTPKIVPIMKQQPKPKSVPILVAPKAAMSPVSVAVEKPIEKPAPPVPQAAPPSPAVVSAPQKAEPAAPKVVQGVAYLVEPKVVYPESARLSGDTGTTRVRALINANGLVDETTVQKTSGSAILDRAALQAVKKARFKPYRENGVAEAVYTVIPIAFSLDGD